VTEESRKQQRHEAARKYRAAHPKLREREREAARKWRADHPEEAREWAAAYPEAGRAAFANWRAGGVGGIAAVAT
jgi:hypothetical protein